ncbi:MAG: polysaccharide lyase [Verrucomicrobiales bacterium]
MRFILPAVLCAFLFSPALSAPETEGLFRCEFESARWFEAWGLSGAPRNTKIVAEDAAHQFSSHRGKALRIKIAEGSHYGTSLEYRFKDQTGSEPEEIYFRYYLRLGDDWDPQTGGKFPGFGGTYGRAGWGGRPVNGSDGWSARGLFLARDDGRTPVGFYCYHADMKGKYGSNWRWDIENRGLLENNRWYCIEQYAKMNTPGENDGILRAWIDGKPAFEKTDVRMRDSRDLKIELIWFNLYHGGKSAAKQDHHIYIDDVVVSRAAIGR